MVRLNVVVGVRVGMTDTALNEGECWQAHQQRRREGGRTDMRVTRSSIQGGGIVRWARQGR